MWSYDFFKQKIFFFKLLNFEVKAVTYVLTHSQGGLAQNLCVQ